MSRFIRKGTFKIDLGDGEWIECRNDIPFDELQPILVGADFKVEANNVRLLVPMAQAAIVAWCLKDDDGNEVPYTKELVSELDTNTMIKLGAELMDKYFVTKKN